MSQSKSGSIWIDPRFGPERFKRPFLRNFFEQDNSMFGEPTADGFGVGIGNFRRSGSGAVLDLDCRVHGFDPVAPPGQTGPDRFSAGIRRNRLGQPKMLAGPSCPAARSVNYESL